MSSHSTDSFEKLNADFQMSKYRENELNEQNLRLEGEKNQIIRLKNEENEKFQLELNVSFIVYLSI
jgi:hypothetical protein